MFIDYLLRHEAVALIAVGILIVSVWGFVNLADEVMEGGTQGFDERVLESVRRGPDLKDMVGPPWLEKSVLEITNLGGITTVTLVVSVVAIFLLLAGHWVRAAVVLLAAGGGAMLTTGLKQLFAITRPSVVPHLTTETTFSFPSGHSTMAATVYLTLGLLLAQMSGHRWFKAYFMCVAVAVVLMVGVSRVMVGVHNPTDVIGGWAVGGAWAILVWLGATRVERLRGGRGESEGRALDARRVAKQPGEPVPPGVDVS